MKTIPTLLILTFGLNLNSQVNIPSNTRADLELIKQDIKSGNGRVSELMKDRFALYDINGVCYVSMLGGINASFSAESLVSMGILVGRPINEVISLKIPLQLIDNIENLPGIEIIQLAGKIKPYLDRAVKDTRADSVHLGIDLPQSYTGKNVLIGITDWGFDYTSPMFYDTLFQNTRILAAWDQYKVTGPAPAGFSYGTEFNDAASLLAAGSDTANIYSYSTHGTHVAGIAGGSGGGLDQYRGFAYESQFLFATFLVDEGAVLDAWEWMYQRSLQEGKRLVINMSWGLYHIGTLDGNSLLSQAIQGYADLGVIFTNSGGNNGNVNFHIKKSFNNDVFTSKIDFYSYSSHPKMWGQSIHMWGEQGKSFESGIKVYNSTGTVLVESPYFSTALVDTYIDTFLVLGSDTVWYNLSADDVHPLNGRPQMRLRVKNTNTSLRVLLKSAAESGVVHYWNVTELSNDVGNWGMPFTTYGSGSMAGDNLYGISEPSCSDGVISVAAYAAQYSTGGSTLAGGGIASFSSIGPRYDEVRKPDIAAPGSAVASSISSFTDASYTSIGSVVFQGNTYPFARLSGTSMASPAVAGICALILEANPYLSADQVKGIISTTAREDNFTGNIPEEGSTRWGYGKINAYRAVKLALETVGTEDSEIVPNWNVYPNPATSDLYFTIVDELPKSVQIIDAQGKVVERRIEMGRLSVRDLNKGIYWIRMNVGGRIGQVKFIKL
jgi:minor extracellular serine protease Vpr